LLYGVGDQTELLRLSSVSELVDYLVDYPEVSDNLKYKTKCKLGLSWQKCKPIRLVSRRGLKLSPAGIISIMDNFKLTHNAN